LPQETKVIVNLSGRGDKDVEEALRVEREGFD
jgi:tryptophan synthase beta subunit